MPDYDAVVIGSGPNGLASAIELAHAGWSVLICEAKATVGGGARTMEVTLPGYYHDICSAIHPLGMDSPVFKLLPLAEHGLEWIQPELALAHPLDDGTAAILDRSLETTAASLGIDGDAYRRLVEPLIENWHKTAEDILSPLRIPRHPIATTQFGLKALLSTKMLVDMNFKGDHARAIMAGMAAHAFIPLDHIATASFGLVLGLLGHIVGWPIPKGGSQKISDALASYFRSLGGEIATSMPIRSMEDLPSARVYLFDVTPRQILNIAGEQFTPSYRRALENYRYGPGIFKIDWALSGPIPWTAEACHRAGTVHLGGRFEEVAAAEKSAWYGREPEKPFVLIAQQSTFDKTRAPEGKHTGWAYCHVPSGSTVDMTDRIEAQIERFAPGFRDLILARTTMNTVQVEQYNPNYIGGDINGGVQDLRQLFTRPVAKLVPYETSNEKIYLCSSSTPPGGGVHGFCGYYAAQAVLRRYSKAETMTKIGATRP